MALGRYWGMNTLPPMPAIERAVYVGPHYALLTGSEFMEVVLDHRDVWQSNRHIILSTLKRAECKRDTS